MYFYKKSSNIASLSYLMYILPMEKDMKNLTKSVELIAKTTASILERMENIETNMATKGQLNEFKLETYTSFNDLRTDLKTFKHDTRNDFDGLEGKIDDMNEVVMSYDNRIEKIEDKV